MEFLIILLLPLVVSLLCLMPPKSARKMAWLTIMGSLAVLVLSVRVAHLIESGVIQESRAFAGAFSSDGLSGLVLVLIAFVGLTSSIFSLGYMGTGQRRGSSLRVYYSLFNLFLFSMLAVPVLAHVAIVWIAVELTTVMSVFLVGFDGTPEALEAAWKYVVLTCVGAAIALVGLLILYWGLRISGGGPFTWQGLKQAATRIPPVFLKAAFLFFLVGFGTKAGLVPMHTWLPDAHSQAPSPVCALLSGVETTTALYAIIRMLPLICSTAVSSAWFITFGMISVGAAAFLLIQVKDYKRLFAFSTIEHMGIILLAVGLSGGAVAFGAMSQVMAHAITKSFCFFAAGSVLLLYQTRDISKVRGLIRVSPVSGAALMLGGLAIAGAPPFAVFLSELEIIKSGLAGEHILIIAGLVLFIGIAFCGIMYHVNKMVFGTPPKDIVHKSIPLSCKVAMALAIIPVVVLGVSIPDPVRGLIHLAALSIRR